MQRRREGAMHGGLWEFPGGKVQPGESLEGALVREIDEELALALDADALVPLAFASDDALVLLLYLCRSWDGTPQCLDGEEIAWFAPSALCGLAMPPLDVPLARALEARLREAI